MIALNLSAHEHKNHEHKDTVSDSLSQKLDTSVINYEKNVMSQEKTKTEEPFKLNYIEEVFEHVHNKLIHFPIALSLLAFLFTLLNLKWKQFEYSIKYIVLISAIFSIPTVITGLNQAGNFAGDLKEWIVGIHKILGIISMSVLWIWMIFLTINPLKRFAWIIGLIGFILITITSFYGGIVAH
jgi:uncharacterized membrane protein